MDITIITGTLWVVSLGLCLLGTVLSFKKRTHASHSHDNVYRHRPITILKPVKGIDSELKNNLKTFFELQHPTYEIIFSVADHDDAAIPIIQDLLKTHPQIDARLIIGDQKIGENPKVNNLITGYNEAKYDWILISDSNVKIDKDYIHSLTAVIKKKTGVVTAIVCGTGQKSFGGELEAMFLNTFYAKFMKLARFAGSPCVIGKAMLFQKSVAERFGGLQILGRFLAEDYMFGVAVQKMGYTVEIANEPTKQHIGSYSSLQFWQRHLRWGRIRKAHAPLAFLIEPFFTNSLISSFLGSVTISQTTSLSALSAFILLQCIWCVNDLIVYRIVKGSIEPHHVLIWLCRELLHIPLWLTILSNDTVNWRGQILQVRLGGAVTLLKKEISWKTQRPRYHFFGALPQVLIKLKVTMNSMIGGNGRKRATLKAVFDQDLHATTGTNIKKISNSLRSSVSTPTVFPLNGLGWNLNLENPANQQSIFIGLSSLNASHSG